MWWHLLLVTMKLSMSFQFGLTLRGTRWYIVRAVPSIFPLSKAHKQRKDTHDGEGTTRNVCAQLDLMEWISTGFGHRLKWKRENSISIGRLQTQSKLECDVLLLFFSSIFNIISSEFSPNLCVGYPNCMPFVIVVDRMIHVSKIDFPHITVPLSKSCDKHVCHLM